ncbi:MAG: hypothetical protein CLLPBCKN_004386 [Chroococcidiopsis cubana SAG 39.79]|nr:hypothetical protein [Chroococcidiopsis cubana SAG 39.79]
MLFVIGHWSFVRTGSLKKSTSTTIFGISRQFLYEQVYQTTLAPTRISGEPAPTAFPFLPCFVLNTHIGVRRQ